ncbi:DUF1345 domain-containing protein [Kitasatospora sp. NPDC048365]|uniref:DUF1345 domain-containing protein n=1 Tax=Kitasatospora sp. NPDC048365 TaxID=3364050 RepID=UPI00371C7CDA
MHTWLSERRRSTVSTAVAVCAAVLLLVLDVDAGALSAADSGVLVLFCYLATYLGTTLTAFLTASPAQVRSWARRESRGTVLQRYLLGGAPGPGVSVFIAAAALVVAMLWLPGHLGSALGDRALRAVVALGLVAVAWVCVAVSFAVSFQADNLVEDERALEFPGEGASGWSDYMYFALSVMTTFGTTDVDVRSREMRRTVAANAVIAFVFNTVTVASLVSALGA